MHIRVELPYELSAAQVLQVFRGYLHQLRAEHFIKDGYVWRVIDMQGRGSNIDEKVGKVDDPDFELIVAAIRMQELTAEICPGRHWGGASYGALPNHRMKKSNEHGDRCVDCGTFRQTRPLL